MVYNNLHTLQNELIERYVTEFHRRTGENLTNVLIAKQMRETQRVSLDKLKNICDSYLPKTDAVLNSISTKTRKTEWVMLRIVFSNIAFSMGYQNKDITTFLELDHSTIIFYTKEMYQAKKNPLYDPPLIQSYYTILSRINNELPIPAIKSNQSYTQPSVFTVLNTRRSSSRQHQRTSRITVSHTGMVR